MAAESTRPSGAYSIHEAKTQFSKLIARAERGEEIVIRRGPTPVAKLVPLPPERRDRGFGSMRGRIWIAEDFDDVLPPEFDEYVS
jgi:prevent-host-death family protein